MEAASDDSDSDVFLSAEEDAFLKTILPKTDTRPGLKTVRDSTALDLSLTLKSEFDLGFSLKIDKPKIPVGLDKDLKTNERIKALNEIIKTDLAQTAAEANAKNELSNLVRQRLGPGALENKRYMDYVVGHYDDETNNIKSICLFNCIPKQTVPLKKRRISSPMNALESYTATDLELVKRQSQIFGSKASSRDLFSISTNGDLKAIATIDSLIRMTSPVFSTFESHTHLDEFQLTELQVFLKNIGADINLINKPPGSDLKDLRSIYNLENLPSIELSIRKLSVGVSIFISDKYALFLRKTSDPTSSAARNIIELDKFERFYFQLLKIVLLALIDSRIHNSPHKEDFHSSQAKVVASLAFENMIHLYMKALSSTQSNTKSFKVLCQKIVELMIDLTSSKSILSQALYCLLQASISSIAKQVVMWLSLAVIVKNLSNKRSLLNLGAEEKVLTYELCEKSIECRNEVVLAKLCQYLNSVRSKQLDSIDGKFRENALYFKDMKATINLLVKLVVLNIPLFCKMEELNNSMYSKTHIVANTDYVIQKHTMIPHVLSVLITQMKTELFRNYDLTANPILGKIMNILGHLILRLEKELTIKVMDLELNSLKRF